jgi:hypothetical protein
VIVGVAQANLRELVVKERSLLEGLRGAELRHCMATDLDREVQTHRGRPVEVHRRGAFFP